ncbi:P-selectin-like [Strongylocentrotus purpuratus]|uniref:Uncharacterized protein n=1 Tax=Strongylocentrotus purpuratus TaxID=7668 RepID=A0A7M7NC81_STRPU|nr:P-selectin-like [Strongylocentrotus purpuratus]
MERTWDNSSNFCYDDNGELLVTVKDVDMQNFIAQLTNENFDYNVWIGAREGLDWKWRQSDTNIDRFFWEIAFPYQSSGDCIELSYQSTSGEFAWSPRSSGDEIGLLCQYKTRMNYEEWYEGQPNRNSQDCVEMRMDFQYQWNDQYCSDRIRTLCQIGIPACGDPGEPLKGHRLPDDRTTYSVGATLHFTCQEGYTLSGESVLRCMNDGAWNHQRPSCEAVECEESPPNITHSSKMILGSVCQDIALYTCQDGYIPDSEPISFCQHTGTWSTPNFTCTVPTPTSSRTFSSPPKSTPAGASSISISTVVGSAVGAILVIVFVIVLIIMFCKRRRLESYLVLNPSFSSVHYHRKTVWLWK